MAFEEMMTGGLSGMGGGQLAALIALGVFAVILALIALAVIYVYTSWAWMTIARKLKHKHPWLAWIPIANGAMVLQLGGFHWAWIFLILIPFLGWIALAVLGIISCWRIFEKRKYPGWLALIPILGFIPFVSWIASLAFLIIIGFVAWKDQ